MILAGSFDRNGFTEESRFAVMIVLSIAAHAVLLLLVSVHSGFTSMARVNAVPDYTPVTIISARDLAATGPKALHLAKARKQISKKQPILIQKKSSIKRLEASKMEVEKKSLTPEKVSPKKEQPASTAARTSSRDRSAATRRGHDTFAVHGIGGAAGVRNIPEITVYTSIVVDRIMEAWFLPPSLKQEALKNNLVMIVGIRVNQAGGVTIQGIEQSSGNNLFDNYALSAIKKVQSESFPPLPDVYRAPYLDLGIRFHPSEIGS